MNEKKDYRVIPYTLLALLINLLGRTAAEKWILPVWCDSIGTFLMAYTYGPVCGAVVGFTNNIVYGIFVEEQSVYCIVGALLGAVVGYFSKKKVFETQFKTMNFGMGLALFSTFIAVVINTIFYEGRCGNVWGNQVMLLCMEQRLPPFVSYVTGQFCVEFLDKLLCAEIVYLLIRFIRQGRTHNGKGAEVFGKFLILTAVLFAVSREEAVMAKELDADYDSYIQITYSNGDGLLSGEANDIAQTKDGCLWIGTYAGLYKYDGAKFKLLADISSVKNVNCLYVDEEGRLWVGTNDDGVTILINGHVMNVIDEEYGLLWNSVKSIVCDSGGNYYIGTTQGLSLVSLSGGVKVTKSFAQVKNIIHMSADKEGNVAVITDRGNIYWFKDGELVETPECLPKNLSYSASYFTGDGRILFGTSQNNILVCDMTCDIPKLVYSASLQGMKHINSFYAAREGELFICSDSGIGILHNDVGFQKLNTNDFSSSIDNMLMDYQGNLWFCSSRLGLLEMCSSPFQELFVEIGETAVVNATEKWEGLLWCGTDEGLLVMDEEKTRRVDNEVSALLADTRVRCVKKDSSNKLWIATTGKGVFQICVQKKGKYEIRNFTEADGLPGMRFRSIQETTDGRTAVAGDFGVAFIEDDSVTDVFSAKNGLNNEKSLCLLEYQGACYVGSDGGGIAKIQDHNVVCNIGKQEGLSSNVILRMVYDPFTDGVFVVTSNGLCYMSSKGDIRSLANFPYSNNYDMVCAEDGTCWILSSAGIYAADTENLLKDEKRDYPLINTKRGLRDSIVANAWGCSDGDELYLCCSSGVVKVNLSQYDMSSKSYRMVLDYVKVDGADCKINRVDALKLSADTEQIVFEPEILNYSMNDPYVSIFLEGYDTKETVCLASELDAIAYSMLKPGTYVFRIAVLDGLDGKVVESGSYTIEKEIEMYQNWWFKLYVFMIAGLVLVWITWFLTKTQAQKVLIKQQLELEYAKKQIRMGNETILSIARTVDAKDSNTSKHSFRVSEYSVAIAKRLNYSDEKCENLRQMALLHDIGKIGIPDAILNKPSRLTDEEYEIMKTHVLKGGEILKDFTMIDNVSLGALYHHEKYDGTGYCHGLKGEEIPLDARIIGIADAFDAMTATRVYRKKMGIEYAVSELKRGSGTQFDPKLVEIMLSLIADGVIREKDFMENAKEDR